MTLPRGRLTTGLIQYPATDIDDHPAVLEDGDEVVWLDDAPGWMLPADEGFYTPDDLVVEIEDRLVEEEELIVGQGRVEVRFELLAVERG